MLGFAHEKQPREELSRQILETGHIRALADILGSLTIPSKYHGYNQLRSGYEARFPNLSATYKIVAYLRWPP